MSQSPACERFEFRPEEGEIGTGTFRSSCAPRILHRDNEVARAVVKSRRSAYVAVFINLLPKISRPLPQKLSTLIVLISLPFIALSRQYLSLLIHFFAIEPLDRFDHLASEVVLGSTLTPETCLDLQLRRTQLRRCRIGSVRDECRHGCPPSDGESA